MKGRGGSWIDALAVAFLVAAVVIAGYFALVSFGVITGYSSHVGTATARMYVSDTATGNSVNTVTVTTTQGGTTYTGVYDGTQWYVFSNLPAGSYVFSASAPGYASGSSNPYTMTEGQTTNGGFFITQTSAASPAPSSTCTDSDGSDRAPGVKGTVTIGTQSWTDSCVSDSVVLENYCYVGNTRQADEMACNAGERCSDGACKTSVTTNLAAYWQFNEASWNAGSASVTDFFGSSSGVPQGGVTTLSQGVGGRGGYFDGSDDFVEKAEYSVSGGGPITVMFWLRVNASEIRDAGIFGIGGGDGSNRANAYLWSNRNLYWDYGEPLDSKGRISIDYSPYYGNWTHVALVSGGNGGNVKAIYINGKQVASASNSDGPDVALSGLTLGMSRDSGSGSVQQRYLKGMLDEVNISYKVASADDIKAVYEQQRRELQSAGGLGLVSHWNFDAAMSADAGAVKDVIGSIGGSAKGGLAGSPGKVGVGAAVFDGVDDEIVVPALQALSFQGPFTISGWFKMDNLTSGDITASWVSKREAYVFGPNRDGSVSLWASFNGLYADARTAPGLVKEGVWQYWSGVYNGTHLLVYLNGTQAAILPVSGSLPATSGELHIGRDFIGAEKRFFKGSIDELQFHDRALSAADADALFKAQLAVAAATPVPPTALTACGSIDKAGTYQLAQPLTSSATCLTIRADNVILDGQGHALRVIAAASSDPLAPTPITTGIMVANVSSFTLKNIKFEGFSTGVLLHRSSGAALEGVTIAQSGEVGLYLNDTNQAFVRSSTIEHGANTGVRFVRSNNNRVDRATIRSNLAYGVNFVSSSNNTLTRMTFASNGLSNVQNDTLSKGNVIELAGNEDSPPITQFVIQPTDLASGYNATIGVGETRLFRVGTTTYNLTVVSLLGGKLTILIKSPASSFTLAQGETQSVDLNVNGRADLNVTFLGTVNNKPSIMLKTIIEAATLGGPGSGGLGGGAGGSGGGSGVGGGAGATMLTNMSNASGVGGFGLASWDKRTMIVVIIALIIFIIFVIIAIVYAVKQQRTGGSNEFYRPEPHSSVLQPSFGGA